MNTAQHILILLVCVFIACFVAACAPPKKHDAGAIFKGMMASFLGYLILTCMGVSIYLIGYGIYTLLGMI